MQEGLYPLLEAVFTALAGVSAPVHEEAPRGVSPPYLTVSARLEGRGARLTLCAWSEYQGSAEALELLAEARAALEGKALPLRTAQAIPVFMGESVAREGILRRGQLDFKVMIHG
jgi:hypothetical protein